MQSLNGYVATRNYRMGPIVTDLFNTGMKQYETDESLDSSLSVYDDNQYELRFTSDDITAGLYHQLTTSFTNYRVVSPGFQYYSQVSKGPVGNMYPDLGGYGGIGFWATYFGAPKYVAQKPIPPYPPKSGYMLPTGPLDTCE